MAKYPKIEDKDFYKKISTIFNKFKIKDKKLNLDDICYPEKFKLQIP